MLLYRRFFTAGSKVMEPLQLVGAAEIDIISISAVPLPVGSMTM